ncbi:NfeD family protein, partial [Pandoraea pneumonica]
WLWFGVAGLIVVLELASGTFYLLMVALGVAAGGIAALLRADGPLQWVVAAIVAGVAVWLLRRSRFGQRRIKVDASADPNTNLD